MRFVVHTNVKQLCLLIEEEETEKDAIEVVSTAYESDWTVLIGIIILSYLIRT